MDSNGWYSNVAVVFDIWGYYCKNSTSLAAVADPDFLTLIISFPLQALRLYVYAVVCASQGTLLETAYFIY